MDESAPNAAEKSFGADVAEDVDVEGMRFEVELYGVDIFDTEMEDNLCSTSEGDNLNESLTHFALGFIQHLCPLSFATLSSVILYAAAAFASHMHHRAPASAHREAQLPVSGIIIEMSCPGAAFSKQALNIHPDREFRLLWGACGPGSTVSSVASAATDIRGQCTSWNAGRAETLCHLIVVGCAAGSTNFSAYGRSSQQWFSIATCSYVRT